MRSRIVIAILSAALVGVLVLHEVQLAKEIAALKARLDDLQASGRTPDDAHGQSATDAGSGAGSKTTPPVFPALETTAEIAQAAQQAQMRIQTLENQVQALSNLVVRLPASRRLGWAEFTMSSLDTGSTDARTNSPARRSWGEEQVIGPPDTMSDGDIPTAWASRLPDGGAEWLSLGFDRQVQVAEVRIRETYNPGAISKVTSLVNGQETLLWEGTATPRPAPHEFSVPVTGNVWTRNIVVHLDTARVPGWNEIDAVELVGQDGSRQWASAVRASSSYAERFSASQTTETEFLGLERR